MGIEPTFTLLQQDFRHNFNLPCSSLPMSANESNMFLELLFHYQPESRFEPGTAGWESRALPLCFARLNIIQTFLLAKEHFKQSNLIARARLKNVLKCLIPQRAEIFSMLEKH